MQDLLPAVTPRGQEKCGSRLLAGLQPPPPSRQREPGRTPQGRELRGKPGPWEPGTIEDSGILGWAAFPFSRGSSQPRDRTQASRIAGRFFTS